VGDHDVGIDGARDRVHGVETVEALDVTTGDYDEEEVEVEAAV
jgi:hypothetical protein